MSRIMKANESNLANFRVHLVGNAIFPFRLTWSAAYADHGKVGFLLTRKELRILQREIDDALATPAGSEETE